MARRTGEAGPSRSGRAAAAIAGVDEFELKGMSAEEFCARSLGHYFAEAASNADPSTLSINYARLNFTTVISALKFFGVAPGEEEVDAIRKLSGLYSKDLSQRLVFRSDGESKRISASAYAREMAHKWAQESFEALEHRSA